MSRRKQPNPNKVRLMENAMEEQREVGGANGELSQEEAGLTEKTHNNFKGSDRVMDGEEEEEEEEEEMENGEEGEERLQNGDEEGGGAENGGGSVGEEEEEERGREGGGGGGGEEGDYLSPINAMMSAVMSAAGTINGEDADPDSSSPNKSTPTRGANGNRNARRNPESKDESLLHICPLCNSNCQSNHQLTMHIRQHNADTGATDHSCSICGKSLSSASSLDRHMLVHSGERPYKCTVCAQTFTTNGNMHRHMKIHEKDPATSLLPVSPTSPTKRRRPLNKRKPGLDNELGEEPPRKKLLDEGVLEEVSTGRGGGGGGGGSGGGGAAGAGPAAGAAGAGGGAGAGAGGGGGGEELPCPICFKICTSRHELDAHMDTHPDTALRCDLCCVSFRTHRGLLRHNAAVHNILPQDPSGRPFIQNNPSIPSGFNDLAFIDFSCKKFTHIAQVWCETNLRRCVSKFHRFVCEVCDKAFPLHSALDLHKTTAHAGPAAKTQERTEKVVKQDPPQTKSHFLESLGLQHISKVKAVPSDDDIHQAHLDSIRVIHVAPSSASSFPQEPAYLPRVPGLSLGLGVGGLAALGSLGLGLPLLETWTSSQRLLSLQPFPSGSFLLQPEGGAAVASAASSGVQPSEAVGGGIMELADIQQIIKVATAAAPNQMGLPPLAKAPAYMGAHSQVQKAMPPLKPKPPHTPRTSLTATTPPPLHSSQQASLGCISPSLPPPTSGLFKTPACSSSSSSSSSSSAAAGNGGQMEADCMGDAHTPSSDSPPVAATAVQEEAGLGVRKVGKSASNGGGAKGSFPCRFCDQVFSFSGMLQAHMRVHLGTLPHQCNICDYVAPDKATLIRHLRTHSGERPYVCKVCHYPFTVKANCERHLRKKHAKTSRKEIEKNIKYITSATAEAGITMATTTTQEAPDGGRVSGTETTCQFCQEDLGSYRALQIHLRTHNGCQRKPFECRRCGAAFLAKRNCIHHVLKQHPEVQEREIEEHIATLLPATTPPLALSLSAAAATTAAAARSSQLAPLNGLAPLSLAPVTLTPLAPQPLKAVKVEELAVYPSSVLDLDQPLDFSAKGSHKGAGCQGTFPAIKVETSLSPTSLDFSALDQPIDLSIPSKRQRRHVQKREIKVEQSAPSIVELQAPPLAMPALHMDDHLGGGSTTNLTPLHPHPQPGCYQLPPGSTPPPAPLLGIAARPLRLKPLLPKPSAPVLSLPPLASIAQIIHSVSGAPDLLKREAAVLDAKPHAGLASAQADAAPGPAPAAASSSTEAQSEEAPAPTPSSSSGGGSSSSSRKRPRKKASLMRERARTLGSGIDLESSGEFASVEKMLATTDTNKFSTYLQTSGPAGETPARRGEAEGQGGGAGEDGGAEDSKPAVIAPQSKGKKNAYSNSVQKMTCPFCPRVFPWASSLQRHMLTHTGQKPFPCPKCDAFFSTKSNCERHLLRKHGVANRSLRRNGSLGRKDGEEGSHDSGESQSETELTAAEAVDLSSPQSDISPFPEQRAGSSEQPKHRTASHNSPASKAGQGPEQPRSMDHSGQQEAPKNRQQPLQINTNAMVTKMENEDDEDCHSNKSLDLNFASKLIDFKFSPSSASGSGEGDGGPPSRPPSIPTNTPPPSSSSSSSSSSTPTTGQAPADGPEEQRALAAAASPAPPPAAASKQTEYKHVCRVCSKSFRYATTLARHERAHLSEETPAAAAAAESEVAPGKEDATETSSSAKQTEEEAEENEEQRQQQREAEEEDEMMMVMMMMEGGDSGESEEEEGEEPEEEERSDEEGGAAEPKSSEEGEGSGGARVDKRKKICVVCGKRFWSLQDLTRHMRSHTGERPYRCQTCERTFTLKHSLVRHQRIHLKPRGSEGPEPSEAAGPHSGEASECGADDASEYGDFSCTPTSSTCPHSENESEGGGGGGGAGGGGGEVEEEAHEQQQEDDEEKEEEQNVSEPADELEPEPAGEKDQEGLQSEEKPLGATGGSPATEPAPEPSKPSGPPSPAAEPAGTPDRQGSAEQPPAAAAAAEPASSSVTEATAGDSADSSTAAAAAASPAPSNPTPSPSTSPAASSPPSREPEARAEAPQPDHVSSPGDNAPLVGAE